MANHKSAKKRIRQNEKRRIQNAGVKSSVRTSIKKVRAAIDEGKKDDAKSLFLLAEQAISKAAGHGLFHQKNASRKISRLAAAVKGIS